MIVNPFESSDFDSALASNRGNVAAITAIMDGRLPREAARFQIPDISFGDFDAGLAIKRSVLTAAAIGAAIGPLNLQTAEAAESTPGVAVASVAQAAPKASFLSGFESVIGINNIPENFALTQKDQIAAAAAAAAKNVPVTAKKAFNPDDESFLDQPLSSYTVKSTGQTVARAPVELPSIDTFVGTRVKSFQASLHGQVYVSPDVVQPKMQALGSDGAPNITDIINQTRQSDTPATKVTGTAKTEKVDGKAKPTKQYGNLTSDKYFPVLSDPAKTKITAADSKVPVIEVPAKTQVVAPTDSTVVNIQNNKKGNGGSSTVILEDPTTHDKSIISGLEPGSSGLQDHQAVKGGMVIGRVAANGLDSGATTGISYMETPASLYGIPVVTKPICVDDCSDLPILDAYKGLQEQSDVWSGAYTNANKTSVHRIDAAPTKVAETYHPDTTSTKTGILGGIIKDVLHSGDSPTATPSTGTDSTQTTPDAAPGQNPAADSTAFLKTTINQFTTKGTGKTLKLDTPDRTPSLPGLPADIPGLGTKKDSSGSSTTPPDKSTGTKTTPDKQGQTAGSTDKKIGKITGLKPGATKLDKVLVAEQVYEDHDMPGVLGVATGEIESGLRDNVRNKYGYTGDYQTQTSGRGGASKHADEIKKAETGPVSQIDSTYPFMHQVSDAADWTDDYRPKGANKDTTDPQVLQDWVVKAQGVGPTLNTGNRLYKKFGPHYVPTAKKLIEEAHKAGPSDAVIFDDTTS